MRVVRCDGVESDDGNVSVVEVYHIQDHGLKMMCVCRYYYSGTSTPMGQ